MSGFALLPHAAAELFGVGATAEEAYGLLTVDVPADTWIAALGTARDTLGCTFFDWLSAVDEPGTGFRVCAHVVALGAGGAVGDARLPAAEPAGDVAATGDVAGADGAAGAVAGAAPAVRKLLLRTTVPYEAAELPTATGVYAGAGWHERETYEMFGVAFAGHPHLAPLLLPDEFEGHPLRKDFVLAARVAKAWPGAKEPGESHDGGPKRRQMQPPGVPDPNDWGPLKGQLPPAPPRPARTPRTAPADRPARRTRSASEGSASQRPDQAERPERSEPSERPQRPERPERTQPSGPDAPWEQPRRTPPPERIPPPEPPPAEPGPRPEPPAEGGDAT
ncbi:NADH-quinone oxidoreductase subunit C [Streptomyces sp. NBC_01190]|uniref:NADH-quinone oxidoreductase subunit C n=1 Tax=Streptomyces sp. NBC_01190 TaxID=2903767 RepID=UPI00386ED4C6|nr:NADH-quinone oxidoreductase subunit C [Streptomyces sp. NBC_01190]